MSAMINSVLTNQFFLMFLAIATGLLIGKIKIGSFSLYRKVRLSSNF